MQSKPAAVATGYGFACLESLPTQLCEIAALAC